METDFEVYIDWVSWKWPEEICWVRVVHHSENSVGVANPAIEMIQVVGIYVLTGPKVFFYL